MLIRKGSHKEIQRPEMRGGTGVVTLAPIADGDELPGKCRIFELIDLPAGASIGMHVHEGESEMFYVLQGTPTIVDDDETYTVQPGDCSVTYSGHRHAVRNDTNGPVRLLANIVRD